MDKAAELKIQLNNYIETILNQQIFRIQFKLAGKSELKKILIEKNESLLQTEAYKNIKMSLRKDIIISLSSKSFKENIYFFIENNLKLLESSNKTLASIIPPTVINSIKVYVYNNSDMIVASIKEIISSKSAEKKIIQEINNILNGLSPMITRFVSPSTIYTRLVAGVNDYLNDAKNINNIMSIINSKLDDIMKKKVSEFMTYFPAEGRKSLIDFIANGIIKNFFSETLIDTSLEKLEEAIKDKLLSLKNKPEILISHIDSLVDSFFENNYSSLLENDKCKELIRQFSEEIVNKLLNKPLAELL